MPLPPTGGSFTLILNMHSVADAVLLIEKMCSQGIILINLIGFLFFFASTFVLGDSIFQR